MLAKCFVCSLPVLGDLGTYESINHESYSEGSFNAAGETDLISKKTKNKIKQPSTKLRYNIRYTALLRLHGRYAKQ